MAHKFIIIHREANKWSKMGLGKKLATEQFPPFKYNYSSSLCLYVAEGRHGSSLESPPFQLPIHRPPIAPLSSLQATQESVYTASYLPAPPPSKGGRDSLFMVLLPCSGPSVRQQSAQSAERSATPKRSVCHRGELHTFTGFERQPQWINGANEVSMRWIAGYKGVAVSRSVSRS
ncbi:hypothetical protein Q8A73_007670 [Channa argus]|nr:hypothetical protein Q8A73_007670 [Channa argus]